MKKKVISLLLCLVMILSLAAGCEIKEPEPEQEKLSEEHVPKGPHAFVFKSEENTFGELIYQGFEEYLTAKGEETLFVSPKETSVEAQVRVLEELVAQQVASITISANGTDGYEEVLKRAQEAGIPIISVDSEVDPDYRVCHIQQVESEDMGAYLVQAAVLIVLGLEYQGTDVPMREVVETVLESFTGEEIRLGVLSASEDTPAQKEWIEVMKQELSRPCYERKVSEELEIKYGNDHVAESTEMAKEFVEENHVDCIIAPTTIGIAAAGEVLENSSSHIKLTGLGLPSEMHAYMPDSSTDNSLGHVCPYMMLWDVLHLGATAGATAYAATYDGFSGNVGETVAMDAFRDYAPEIFEVYQSGAGTAILAGRPYIFYKENIEKWIPLL